MARVFPSHNITLDANVDLDGDLEFSSRQVSDPNNTITITSASITGNSPGNPWVGTPFATRTRNIQENLSTVVAFNSSSLITDLGGLLLLWE